MQHIHECRSICVQCMAYNVEAKGLLVSLPW